MSSQKTLEGDDAEPTLFNNNLEDVEFYYYETNYTPTLNDAKPQHKEACIEEAREYMQLSSRIQTADMTEDELEELASEFVRSVFKSVWQMIDSEGYSLWINYEGKYEIPIYIQSPLGMFTSASALGDYGDGQSAVSDSFLKAVGQLTREEQTEWSNCEEELFNELSETEQKLFYQVRNALVGMTDMSPELAIMIEKGKQLLDT